MHRAFIATAILQLWYRIIIVTNHFEYDTCLYTIGMCAALRIVADAGDVLHEMSAENDEVAILCGGIRRVLLPFLIQEDHSRFLSLLRDVFGPASQTPRDTINPELMDVILQVKIRITV
jgi:hypothetical protein